MIPYGRQEVTDEDIKSVIDVLKSDFLTQGPVVPEFEQQVCNYAGAVYGVAVNSATSALHIACLALGLKKGDVLWTTAITFVASANCARYCGAEVDFVDIDQLSYNMSVKSLEEKLILANEIGKLPKIVIPVHLSGQSCEMQDIYRLSKKYNFSIIEDASHAIGGKYKGESIGNCRYSDITVFSFHPVKIITTCEGGMALTNNNDLASKMELFRSHGITRDNSLMNQPSHGDWYYQQISLGFNYRMTELQAALGLSQLKRLDNYVKQRHDIAIYYTEKLSNLPVVIPWQHPDSYSGLHLYIIRLKLDLISMTHKDVFKALRQNGIGVNLHYIPVYHQPYYEKMGFMKENFPNAEKYYSEAISLPMYPTLSTQDLNTVIDVLGKVFEK